MSLSQEKQEGSYLLFRIVFTLVREHALRPLGSAPKSRFEFGSINVCQNSLDLSKKLRIVISIETSEFLFQA
jgi:hypothetical protein